MLFISHANPDDNEKAQWLSLQLARIGFSVWSDVTKLIGGDLLKVIAWYDNEWGYANRLVELAAYLSKFTK